MADPTTPEEAIEDNVLNPRSVQIKGHTVEEHPLPDQIKAAQFLANQKAKRSGGTGLKTIKLIPGGTG